MAVAGQPGSPMIPVRGGSFGHDTEASLGQIFEATFGPDATEAIKHVIADKQAEIAKKREADAKKAADEEAKLEAKEKADEEAKAKKDAKEEAKAHPHAHPHPHSR